MSYQNNLVMKIISGVGWNTTGPPCSFLYFWIYKFWKMGPDLGIDLKDCTCSNHGRNQVWWFLSKCIRELTYIYGFIKCTLLQFPSSSHGKRLTAWPLSGHIFGFHHFKSGLYSFFLEIPTKTVHNRDRLSQTLKARFDDALWVQRQSFPPLGLHEKFVTDDYHHLIFGFFHNPGEPAKIACYKLPRSLPEASDSPPEMDKNKPATSTPNLWSL